MRDAERGAERTVAECRAKVKEAEAACSATRGAAAKEADKALKQATTALAAAQRAAAGAAERIPAPTDEGEREGKLSALLARTPGEKGINALFCFPAAEHPASAPPAWL